MTDETTELLDYEALRRARGELGAAFVRILGYFREDGAKSVGEVEDAMRRQDAAAMVIPAHTLKGEAHQFGAEPLALLAEIIEEGARRCVETRVEPDELLQEVVKLRPLFRQTLALLEREANPLAERRPAFGRKAQVTQAIGGY